MFEEILKIKKHHESQAERLVFQRKDDVRKAVSLVSQKKQELKDFQDYRAKQEQYLYNKLCGQMVKVISIDEVKFELVKLREEEEKYVQAIMNAENALENAKNLLDQSRSAHQETIKKKNKFIELLDVVKQDSIAEQIYKEEQELEDVPRKRSDGHSEY
jgi:hypothetical protein